MSAGVASNPAIKLGNAWVRWWWEVIGIRLNVMLFRCGLELLVECEWFCCMGDHTHCFVFSVGLSRLDMWNVHCALEVRWLICVKGLGWWLMVWLAEDEYQLADTMSKVYDNGNQDNHGGRLPSVARRSTVPLPGPPSLLARWSTADLKSQRWSWNTVRTHHLKEHCQFMMVQQTWWCSHQWMFEFQ